MEANEINKTPYNIEVEEALLGSIFIKPDALSDVLDLVSPSDFYKNNYKTIYTEIIKLYNKGEQLDSLIIINSMKKSGVLEEVGGEELIVSLSNAVPTAANIRTYAKIVREKSIQRQLVDTGTKIVEMAYEGYDDAQTMLDKAETMVFKVAESKEKKDIVTLNELAHQELERMENLPKGEGITGIPTKFTKFDEMTNGLGDSDLVILAARPAMGKTAFGLNLALNAAEEGKTVLLFSLEMSNSQLYQRLLAIESRVPMNKIRTAQLKEDEWARVAVSAGKLAETPILIADSPGVTTMEIRAISRRLKAEGKLDMIILDYLQLIRGTGNGRSENRQQEISEISRTLKILARELNVPIIALSQLSRAPELRADKRPILSDLRESGAIEQDADVVIFLYRDEYYDELSEDVGLAEIIIGKQRNGPTGKVVLRFFNEIQRFASYTTRD